MHSSVSQSERVCQGSQGARDEGECAHVQKSGESARKHDEWQAHEKAEECAQADRTKQSAS